MSHVTSVIVTARTYDEADTSPGVDAINQWLAANGHPPLLRVDTAWRGAKVIEIPIWIGAFDHLDIAGFLEVAHADGSVSVSTCGTGDDLYVPAGEWAQAEEIVDDGSEIEAPVPLEPAPSCGRCGDPIGFDDDCPRCNPWEE